ncbi:hypothetical protein BGZ96_011712 [Linnemannia gamsii]|uniref:AAA+ ATPase domain-containing protein n=1 Tax=Linnemannia gamsii TaxID=64522 RepID=A0ABQ7JRS4_9FUNG|nr:hypothetical protein BGZ96_011712 [Linnemannia gamsii]
MNPYSEFTCLYTSQKQKKAKTWHDGNLKYFHNNSKVVLYDEKFNVLDSTFHRGAALAVGDDMDMDKHLVTVEDLTVEYATNSGDSGTSVKPIASTPTAARTAIPVRSAPSYQKPKPAGRQLNPYTSTALANTSISSTRPIDEATATSAGRPANGFIPQPQQHQSDNTGSSNNYFANAPQPDLKRKKWRAPFTNKEPSPSTSMDEQFDQLDESDFGNWDNSDMLDFVDTHPQSALGGINGNAAATRAPMGPTATIKPISTSKAVSSMTSSTGTVVLSREAPKRRKVGLSRPTGSLEAPTQASLMAPHKPPSSQLEFPNAARCTNFTGKNSGQLLRRSMALGSRFASTNQYRDSMTFLIYEHLQIMVIEIAVIMWGIKSNGKAHDGDTQDPLYRSRGVHIHSGSTLRRRGDVYTGFPLYRGQLGAGGSVETTAVVQPSAQQGAVLSLSNKEHHSKYSKDDLWVVSQSSRFDAASTFFARSVFYGPSGNDVEITCLSHSDSSKARDLLSRSNQVCAIRLFNGMSEFMMLDNLQDGLTKTPLLPTLLNYVPPELVKASKTAVFKAPSRIPEKSGCIVLTEEDGIDMEIELQDTIEKYGLNFEQAGVLRNFALTVVRAPGWSPSSSEPPPILLVHGVFGAGKSFLIAVLIVFIDLLLSKARPLPKDVRSCRFLVTSMTNVAVDRILMALLDLNYNKFVRVGSLKKVARRVLPFTAQSTSARKGEDIKELQAMLNDDSLSIKERQYVKDAMKRFQREENRGLVEKADVVGATCVASMFEVMDEASFPIVILDEASQLLEPMSLIPICRAGCQKVVMVGDPLQLSPPINTNGDSAAKGLSRTLFDRSIEMGIKPIMLRTQYRCHERIAEISNTLFYSNVLKTGPSMEDRAPLIEGLPTLTFIENQGQEIQNPRSKSYTNPAEIKLVVTIIQCLLHLNIPETSIGVISLYKSQADGIESELNEQLKNSGQKGGVQISTGSEKEVIIVSTVRTDAIGFIDNHQRVNVALTRAKRHLYVVGFSQLLYSNKTWCSILKDHCGATQDGMMTGQGFMQRLRTLTPLQRQATPPPQMQLVESEDEDEELRDGRREEERRYLDHVEQDEYEVDDHYDNSGYSSHRLSATVPGQARSRKYALYQADEESDDEYDDQETRGPITKSSRSGGSGPLDLRGRQNPPRDDGYPHERQNSSHDAGYIDQPHIPVVQGHAQRYTGRARKVQKEAVRETSDSYDHVSDDDDEKGLEDLLSAHRDAPFTPPPPSLIVQRSSRPNNGMQRNGIDVEPDSVTPSEQMRTAQVHAHLPEIALERNADCWKKGVDDALKERPLEYELEVEEEVVWEMGEESESDAHVDAHAEPDRQSDENRVEIRKADNKNSSSMKEENMEMIELDPSVQQQQHEQQLQQEVDRERTKTPSQGLYESQRIEDLDVVGLSQWASPPQHLQSKESTADTTVVSAAVGVVALGLVGGADVTDVVADMRPMATASRLQREEQEEDNTSIVGESQGRCGGLMIEGEEDDISCLDVEGFDY